MNINASSTPQPEHQRMQPEPITALEARIREALLSVQDPEMGENIVDLGLLEGILVDEQGVQVTLIPTSATCPMADVILDDAQAAVEAVCPAGTCVEIDMDWQQAWSPDRLAPALRERFGW